MIKLIENMGDVDFISALELSDEKKDILRSLCEEDLLDTYVDEYTDAIDSDEFESKICNIIDMCDDIGNGAGEQYDDCWDYGREQHYQRYLCTVEFDMERYKEDTVEKTKEYYNEPFMKYDIICEYVLHGKNYDLMEFVLEDIDVQYASEGSYYNSY